MTPDQAIQILDAVTAQQPLIRSDQQQVMQALQVLREATAEKPAEPKPRRQRKPKTE